MSNSYLSHFSRVFCCNFLEGRDPAFYVVVTPELGTALGTYPELSVIICSSQQDPVLSGFQLASSAWNIFLWPFACLTPPRPWRPHSATPYPRHLLPPPGGLQAPPLSCLEALITLHCVAGDRSVSPHTRAGSFWRAAQFLEHSRRSINAF